MYVRIPLSLLNLHVLLEPADDVFVLSKRFGELAHLHVYHCVHTCVCVAMCVNACVCVHVCVHVCVCMVNIPRLPAHDIL